MPAKRHAIFTCSDAKFGDFVLNHWLVSLRANVNLSNIDIHFLDYGITEDQQRRLEQQGVTCHPCVRDGNISNIRYRDLALALSKYDYDQVMTIDGGDIIFQSDISDIFEQHQEHFRGACHEFEVPFHEMIMSRRDFSSTEFQRISEYLHDKPTINGGMLLGPGKKMASIWQRFTEHVSSFAQFGIDQFLINYILFKEGFVEIDSKYNYSIIARTSEYTVRKGVFYDERGEVIPIVHNSGIYELTRPIARFGYGPQYNRKRVLVPAFLRASYHVFNWFRPSTVKLKDARSVQRNPGVGNTAGEARIRERATATSTAE